MRGKRIRSQRRPPILVGALAVVCVLVLIVRGVIAQPPTVGVRVTVHDKSGKALSGVSIGVINTGQTTRAVITGADGEAVVECPRTANCDINVTLSGYLSVQHRIEAISVGEGAIIDIVLPPALQDQQNVIVQGNMSGPLLETENSQTELKMEDAKLTPLRPATLLDTLPLVPSVARTPDGRITIAGADEAQSTLLVNAVNVTDPATGGFGLSVPVDSVDLVKRSEERRVGK